MEIKQLTNKEFNNFINNFKNKSIYQTPEYGFVMNHENFDTVFFGLEDNNKIIGASLILIQNIDNFKYAYAPKGFLIDYENKELLKIFTEKIKKYLGKLGIVAIKINPIVVKNIYSNNNEIIYENNEYNNIFNNLKGLGYNHLGYNNYFEGLKPRYEAILDINKSYYTLFKNIKKQNRTKIRGAEKLGIKIYKGNINNLDYLYVHTKNKYPRELEYFKNCYNYFSKNDNIEFYFAKLDTVKFLKNATKNFQEQEEICNKIDKEIMNNNSLLKEKMENDKLLDKYKSNLIYATKLLSKYPDGVVTSSALIVKNDKTINLLMDGYDTNFKRLNSKNLLIWKLLQKYSELGYEKFNFGGITNPNLKDNKYSGLNEFKLSFNSNIYEYIGDFELITNKPLYFIYKNKLKIKKNN